MAGSSEEAIQQEFIALEKVEAEDTDGIVALPGAVELLARLNELDIPWAIVTSGSVPVASARRKAAGLPEPEVFVTAERVQNGKPEPDAYLLGAQLLELEPEECVVVEDAAAGILSGLAAGCHVVAVNAPAGSPRLEDVDMLLYSLEELVIHKNADGSIDVHRKH
jgi:sugar-phosphatase